MPRFVRAIILSLIAVLCATCAAFAQKHLTGTFSDGATYVIDVPSKWNGTLLLYSHGYVLPGDSNPAEDAGDPLTGAYLLDAGYALAGSSYASTGWAVEEAIPDQISTLNEFKKRVGKPKTTIAWGHSLGGMITAALVQQYPADFNAAMPMCGVVAGGVGLWNEALDGAFAFNTLLADNSLQIVNITNPIGNLDAAETTLTIAQSTAAGKARIALVAALEDTPGWYDPTSAPPAATDYTDQEINQYSWLGNVDFGFAFALRAELEERAGGNPSFNDGVDYATQLKNSVNYKEVQALYKAAGLDLDTDLNTLASASRITADSSALTYLSNYVIYNGQISVPVLTFHTTGDGLVPVEDEQAYAQVVGEVKDSAFLKQTFVKRAGHCEFSPAETITAFQALEDRLMSGVWPSLSPSALNKQATALGSALNVIDANGKVVPAAPAFLTYKPAKFLRIYDAFRQ